ncbi:HDOD domain-containing protein [Niallia sp. XMNu-256]|uniref:EAL and HDOD domain-containing protein n=1 Tax=Niallia sp. XMNu-256 TaxID=3082444 RepID=UPI0030CDCBAF
MKVYVAKQPIYDTNEKLVGYELLYRKDSTNVFPQIDGDQATAEVVINTHLNIGLHRITEGKLYCIQFTEKLLEQKLPTFFNPKEMLVKISNEVVLTTRLIKMVYELKQLGYGIIISDILINFDFPLMDALFANIDYLTVDFSDGLTQQHDLIEKVANKFDVQLVAEKIEKREYYIEAKNRGYSLFQGYLFSEPMIESSFEIPTVYQTDQLLAQDKINSMNEDELVQWVERDLSFSIKLLRLINTSQSQSSKVCSIRKAITLIGLEEVKKWIQLLMVRYSIKAPIQLSNDINRLILTRAKLCEKMGKLIGSPHPSGFYLMGLISAIEKMNVESMEEILDGIPIKDELYEALIGVENEYKLVLDLVQAVEQANWRKISEKCKRLKISERDLFRLYAVSLNWTNHFTSENKRTPF